MRAALVVLVALAAVSTASAGDDVLLAAKVRYLPPAQRAYSSDADGLQARYDAGRDLVEAVRRAGAVSPSCAALRDALLRYGRTQVVIAEQADWPVPSSAPRTLPAVPSSCRAGGAAVRPAPVGRTASEIPRGNLVAAPEGPVDSALASKLAALGAGYRGWAGFWVHDLRTGRTAGWNADAVFPAGSEVKLGALAAGLRRFGATDDSPLYYDLAQIGAWSSNLGANRVARIAGILAIGDALRRLGMWSSTYPGLYRAGTSARIDAPKPPPRTHTRVTTAHDLGRALYRLHATAIGNGPAQRQTGLTRLQAATAIEFLRGSKAWGPNAGLLRPWLPRATMAQKNAWLSDLRATAAIVYTRTGPVVVVVEAYRPGLQTAEARGLGRRVVRLLALDRRSR